MSFCWNACALISHTPPTIFSRRFWAPLFEKTFPRARRVSEKNAQTALEGTERSASRSNENLRSTDAFHSSSDARTDTSRDRSGAPLSRRSASVVDPIPSMRFGSSPERMSPALWCRYFFRIPLPWEIAGPWTRAGMRSPAAAPTRNWARSSWILSAPAEVS